MTPERSHHGQTALITGATSGIGLATAIAFGQAGAHVLVGGRDEARGEAAVGAAMSAGGRATLLIADLTDHQATLDLAKRALEAANRKLAASAP